ncbi:M15 family metallopeptidase [Symbioplanes lichenis]|uniref:M15 family metallopeptidase n=1 Tax=Symbioplanes lichenis TaxID=1629072 RepID=UPI0027388B89|nr:M15 family metallopeptidase [Actinoplanes lichenis]
MTTRQESQTSHRVRGHVRRSATAVVAGLAAVLTAAGTGVAPAEAAVPQAATQWASLMRQSLTPSPAYVKLAGTLATQRTTLATRAAQVKTRTTEHTTAQNALAVAVANDSAARTRYAIAREALATARNRLTVVSQQRPRNAAAVTTAKEAVTARANATIIRRTQATAAATALKTAQATASTATTSLDSATTNYERMATAVRTNQQRLVALDTRGAYTAQAAGLSSAVVNQVRASFSTADATTVEGITVHKSVAFAFGRMLADARKDGIVMSGGGFRTKQRQIELRKINGCPDVYTAPASSCRVPTAIPGRSLHEIGLAVDMTSGGRTLTSGSPAFKWLTAHAAEYGYKNLPSEAWHWSITGG